MRAVLESGITPKHVLSPHAQDQTIARFCKTIRSNNPLDWSTLWQSHNDHVNHEQADDFHKRVSRR